MQNKISFLAALCMFLSAVEYAIPKPLPFMRLGLANLPILLSLDLLSFPEIILLAFLKILCQGLISGTLLSYAIVFSVAGTFSSVLVMWALNSFLKKSLSSLGLSVAGAVSNSFSQIVCARVFMFGGNVRYIAPVMLVSGVVTGVLLGLVSLLVMNKSLWYKNFSTENAGCGKLVESEHFKENINTFSTVIFVFGLLLMAAFLLVNQWVQNLYLLWSCDVVLLFALELKKKWRYNLFTSLIVCFSVVLVALFVPNGKVLYKLGRFPLTLGALKKGLFRAGLLLGMTYVSSLIVDKRVQIPGKTGILLSKTFVYFDLLCESDSYKIQKKKFPSPKEAFFSIDRRLERIWGTDSLSGDENGR